MTQEATFTASGSNSSVSALEAFVVHSVSAVGLAIALWVSHNLYSINLISHPSETLYFIWVTGCPIAILIYSRYRQSPQCSYFRAVGHGIIGLLAGALICAFGAVALGAPISTRYISKTINWSLTMSLFTVVPAASVFGSSWTDWQRIFVHTKAIGNVDFMISVPAHGALIGAWFGAWPMPLDWERQWQEWPIIVTYGSIAGYLIGTICSFGFVLYHSESKRMKKD